MGLGDRIYELRTKKKLSQGDLADILGVSRQSISKWETNCSTPDLDKLIRLSEIFGLSLDELVTGEDKRQETSNNTHNIAPQIVYIEKSQKNVLHAPQILGIILLSCSLLALVLFACFGKWNDLFEVFALCLPVALLGILCLFTKHPFLWCGWCGSALWWIHIFVLSARWEKAVMLLIIGIVLVIVSSLYTIYLHKNQRIHIPTCGWVVLVVLLAGALILLVANIIPPGTGTVTVPMEIPIAPDVSVVID